MTAQTQLGVIGTFDDNMELATSPFQAVEDLDLDFDQMNDGDNNFDKPMDDLNDGSGVIDDVMDGEEDLTEDENMIQPDSHGDPKMDHDFDMNEFEDGNTGQGESHEEDDILYDEEEEHAENDGENKGVADAESSSIQRKDFAETHHEGQEPELTLDDTDIARGVQQQIPNEIFEPEQEGNEETASSTRDDDATSGSLKPTHKAASEAVSAASLDDKQSIGKQSITNGAENKQDGTTGQVGGVEETVAVAETTTDKEEPQLLDLASIEDSAVEEALQAVRILWNDEEWRLFSHEAGASDAFFHGTSLAYEPMDKLLSSCRTVIPEEELEGCDELVLNVDGLNLTICEDSRFTLKLTLAQVIELYVNIHRNASQAPVVEIHCSLEKRMCLETQYTRLLEEARSGKSLVDILEGRTESPDDIEEHYPDDTETGIDAAVEAAAQQEEQSKATDPTVQAPAKESIPPATQVPADDHNASTESAPVEHPVDAAIQEQNEEDFLEEFELETEEQPQTNGGETHNDDSSHTVEETAIANDTTENASVKTDGTGRSRKQGASGDFGLDLFTADDDPIYQDPGAPPHIQETPMPLGTDEYYNSDNELIDPSREEAPNDIFDHVQSEVELTEPVDENPEADLNSFNLSEGLQEQGLDLLNIPPGTPQRVSPQKRKAEEDEFDFELSGLDTPEPKRRRPS